MKKLMSVACTLALSLGWSASAFAANATVDCTKKAKIQAAIDKFDKSVANTVTVIGACVENLVVSGHRDLTLVAGTGASLTAAAAGTAALEALGSRLTMRNIPVNGNGLAFYVISCNDRSVCILENVSASGSDPANFGTGIQAQKQSAIDLIGSPATVISGNTGAGIGVAGQSSLNISASGGFDQPGITITGNGNGIDAIDGSFVRVENAQITNNTGNGIGGSRGAVLKVFGTTISGNGGSGIFVRASTLQVNPQFGLPANITNNAGPGVVLRHLSFGQITQPTISGNGGPYPNGVDCLSTGALRTDGTTRGASNPLCLVE